MIYFNLINEEVIRMNYKIKIKENKSWDLTGTPRFSIEINQAKSPDMEIKNNFDILSKLVGTDDVIISLNNTLFNLHQDKNQPIIQQFLETIQDLSLKYKCMEITKHPTSSFFSFLFGRNKEENGQEILAYIPNDVWINFQNKLPYYGARYFILKNKPVNSNILEDMLKMSDGEKLEYFKMIVFNSIYLSRMGICSRYLSLSELKDLLGV